MQKEVSDFEQPLHEVQQIDKDIASVMDQCTDNTDKQMLSERLAEIHSTSAFLQQFGNERVATLTECMNLYSMVQSSNVIIASLQKRLETKEIGLSELDEMKKKLDAAHENFNMMAARQADLPAKIKDSRIAFKDRETQRNVSLKAETDSLQHAFMRTESLLKMKTEKQNEFMALWSDLRLQKSQLVESLNEISTQIETDCLPETSLKGVAVLEATLHSLESYLYSLNTGYEEFRKSCWRLRSLDTAHQDEVQKEQSSLESQWEAVHKNLALRLAAVDAVQRQWKLYEDAKKEIQAVLEPIESMVQSETSVTSHKEALQKFNAFKVSVFILFFR